MTLSHRPMRPVARVRCLATALLVIGLGACATPVDQHKRVEAYGRANPATLPNRPDDSLLLSLPAHREAFTHYIEFRARYALSYGHTFVVHGTLVDGRIATREIAGLHPKGDNPAHWMLGHVIPVISETGASDGDAEDAYLAARYRINLTAAQYAKVSGFIRQLQQRSPVWHAVLYNCNAFVADIAHVMGLRTPGHLELPADFINGIRRMNGGVPYLPPGL